MAKKSHRIASRQAAVGKERKRKKKAQTGEKQVVSYTAPPAATDVHKSTVDSVPEPVSGEVAAPATTGISPSARTDPRESARYQYVIADLRTIAIIAGPLIVLLIILAFIL